VQTDFDVMGRLLEYELLAAERYRRFVSLVMVTSQNDLEGLRALLGEHVRESDVMSNFDHSVAVLMGETDGTGALSAIDRFRKSFDSQIDMRFSVVTYPSDGGKAEGLIDAAYRRLGRARQAVSGAVVCTD